MNNATPSEHKSVGSDARILSLVPSITETLFSLGLGNNIVGRTAFCVHPKAEVKRIASLGGTKSVNMNKVRRAAPTHAILNIDENPKQLADDLVAAGIQTVVTHPTRMADNPALFQRLGNLFGKEAEAQDLCEQFNQALRRAFVPHHIKRVLYLIWNDPWMTISTDTYISDALRTIGWETVAPPPSGDGPPARYPALDPTTPLHPVDLVVFSSEPFPFKPDHVDHFRAAFPAITAPAIFMDGEMTSWYGSRSILALDYLSALARSMEQP